MYMVHPILRYQYLYCYGNSGFLLMAFILRWNHFCFFILRIIMKLTLKDGLYFPSLFTYLEEKFVIK